MMKTLLDRSCAGMVLEALSSAKDPRAGLTAGGMTEGLSFDMHILPEYCVAGIENPRGI